MLRILYMAVSVGLTGCILVCTASCRRTTQSDKESVFTSDVSRQDLTPDQTVRLWHQLFDLKQYDKALEISVGKLHILATKLAAAPKDDLDYRSSRIDSLSCSINGDTAYCRYHLVTTGADEKPFQMRGQYLLVKIGQVWRVAENKTLPEVKKAQEEPFDPSIYDHVIHNEIQ